MVEIDLGYDRQVVLSGVRDVSCEGNCRVVAVAVVTVAGSGGYHGGASGSYSNSDGGRRVCSVGGSRPHAVVVTTVDGAVQW